MNFQEKADKIKQLYHNFLNKLADINKRKLETYKNLETQKEQEQIKKIEEKIKNL